MSKTEFPWHTGAGLVGEIEHGLGGTIVITWLNVFVHPFAFVTVRVTVSRPGTAHVLDVFMTAEVDPFPKFHAQLDAAGPVMLTG